MPNGRPVGRSVRAVRSGPRGAAAGAGGQSGPPVLQRLILRADSPRRSVSHRWDPMEPSSNAPAPRRMRDRRAAPPRALAWARAAWLGASVALLAVGMAAPALAQARTAHVAEMKAIISPITERYLVRTIEAAARDGAEVIVVTLDTPGGLLDATRGMVERILGSPVPVIVYVSPSGAHAASAGTFITAAAHVAAMAPRDERRSGQSGRRAGRGDSGDAEEQGVRGRRGRDARHRGGPGEADRAARGPRSSRRRPTRPTRRWNSASSIWWP